MVTSQESMTSMICAFVRAWYSRQPGQKLCDDYLAFDLIGADGYQKLYQMTEDLLKESESERTDDLISEYVAPILVSRVWFLQKKLCAFEQNFPKIQYVICGAGSDTFGFRCNSSKMEIYEVDHPDTQKKKLERLKKRNWKIPDNLHFVPNDFEKDYMSEQLKKCGFNPQIPTLFSIMGVSYYLTFPVFRKTLIQIMELSAEKSMLVFDYPQKTQCITERMKRLADFTDSMGESMQGGFDYLDIWKLLNDLGFQIEEQMNSHTINNYFLHANQKMKAFDNINLIAAVYKGKL